MFKNFINILVVFVLSGALLTPARAVDLGDAFDSITAGVSSSVSGPGFMASQSRIGATGGGIDIRAPRTTAQPQLVSLTPPTVSAGCNGISAHFGGFTFISGAEFGKLLKNIASGAALGFVSSLVMKTLCPACQQVIAQLQDEATKAAKSMRDSCQLGRNLAADFKSSVDRSQMCTNLASNIGNSAADAMAAYFGVCNQVDAAVKEVKSSTGVSATDDSDEGKAKNSNVNCAMQSGNVTWLQLKSFEMSADTDQDTYTRRLLLMNILGAEMGSAPEKTVSCDSSTTTVTFSNKTDSVETKIRPDTPINYCAPTIDVSVLTGLFLCGGESIGSRTDVSSRIKDYCRVFFDAKQANGLPAASKLSNATVWTCGDDKVFCNEIKRVPASEVINGNGFLVTVNKQLLKAVENIKNNVGFDTPEGRDTIKLINLAPYPLYQAINAAAVYPAAATDLIDSMSILVAEQMAYAKLEELLKLRGKTTSAVCPMRQDQANRLLDFMQSFRNEAAARKSLMGQSLATQQALTMQIREINSAISQKVLSDDLLTSGAMSENINNMVTPANAGAQK